MYCLMSFPALFTFHDSFSSSVYFNEEENYINGVASQKIKVEMAIRGR